MNQQLPLQYFAKAFSKGMLLGALASLAVYGSIRLLFMGYAFTPLEELTNVCRIILTGGLITGFAVIAFLLLENIILFSRSNKFTLSPVFMKKISTTGLVIFAFGFLLKWML
ncbi:MAG: hypothetical protein ABJA78_14185 [Ferruginibacter sp.]